MSPLFSRLGDGLLDPAEAAAQAAETERRAAVACIFLGGDELQVLLMRRAERPGDRWSGQVSFPGGHAEEADADLASTARRETREEVGLDLTSATLLGCLPSRAAKSGGPVSMSITPFVYRIEEPPELVLGPEAASSFWLPFGRACGGELDDHYPFQRGSVRLQLPAWRFADQVIWGMTYEMLQELKARALE